MPISWQQIVSFIRLSRPLHLLGGILFYGLGVAIADYLGRPLDLTTYILGQILILCIQLMAQYLNEYANSESSTNVENRFQLPFTGGNVLGSAGLPRRVPLYAAAFSLTLVACVILLMIFNLEVPWLAWGLLVLIFLGAFLYDLKPFNLATSGYGEITMSFITAGLVPAFAYAIQTGEIHRFILMSCTPLVALTFAALIAFELPNFASDSKFGRRNLLLRVNWPTAMRLHDIAILFAVVSIILAFFLGMPRRVALGTLIALPLVAAQLWQMDRIRQGYPARWRTLTLSAIALIGLTTYLEIIGYLLS